MTGVQGEVRESGLARQTGGAAVGGDAGAGGMVQITVQGCGQGLRQRGALGRAEPGRLLGEFQQGSAGAVAEGQAVAFMGKIVPMLALAGDQGAGEQEVGSRG